MQDIKDNNLVRFIKISKTKEGLFANYRVKGIKGGSAFSTTISVDLSAAEVTAADTLEAIIEKCADVAVREYKKSDFRFEGLAAV